MDDLLPIIAQAARHLGLFEDDVIASKVTETEVILVFRQGWKKRVPLSELTPVSAETSNDTADEAEPAQTESEPDHIVSEEPSETDPDEAEPARPRRRRNA